MQEYILPYGDFLCYCLMPNHFHWLVYVRETVLEVPAPTVGVTQSHADSIPVHSLTQSHADSVPIRSLNDSIGILLRSYTRAINKQEDRSGALFREKTKATDGWEDHFLPITHPSYGKKLMKWGNYGLTAFHYIHQNPVKARLAAHAEDWAYSSAADFAGIRNSTLCNQTLAKSLLFFL